MRTFGVVLAWVTMLVMAPLAIAQQNAPAQDQQQPAARETAEPQQPAAEQTATADADLSAEAKAFQSQMATCLKMANQGEIELAKVALDKSQNEQVRELAQTMIDDHTTAVNDLKRFIGEHATAAGEEAAATEDQSAKRTQTAATDSSATTEDQWQALAKKIHKNELAMTKDVLMRYEGQDFDMGYLGQQIIAHTQMLAKLHAMKTQGSQEFQLSVHRIIGTVNDHFRHATQLSKQLQNREYSETSPTSATSPAAERRTVNRPIQDAEQPATKPQQPAETPQDE